MPLLLFSFWLSNAHVPVVGSPLTSDVLANFSMP